MRYAQTVTLFSDPNKVEPRSSSYIVSTIAHCAIISIVLYVALFAPHVKNKPLPERLTVRHLDLNLPDPITAKSNASGVPYPGPHPDKHTPEPAGKPAAEAAVLRQEIPEPKGLQTLIQLKSNPKLVLPKDIPIPTVVLVTPEKTLVKTIVPPKPTLPTAAPVLPSMHPPNEEQHLADIPMPASALTKVKMPLMPSTTTPIAVQGPDLPQKAPQTTTQSNAQSTPTTVISLSDVQLKQGSAVLPPANQSASSSSQGALTQGHGQAQNPSEIAQRITDGRGGSGASAGAGDSKAKPSTDRAAGSPNGAKTGPGSHTGAGSPNGSSQGNSPPMAHIALPKAGVFSSVLVGVSLAEKYPEAKSIWSGRLAYTVYLHVGLTKSWILQYSLPHSADAAAAGNNLRLDPPWPFNIVRPAAGPGDLNADALMIHGFVNQAGRFEGLTIVFPTDFAQGQLMLDSLSQWEFRPAKQNGQNVRVEVLLIIPEEVQ
jgi:hypothetical protein